MIGHLVNILTPEEEDRLLTGRLGCFADGECLLQRVSNAKWAMENRNSRHFREWRHSLHAFPTLAMKYPRALISRRMDQHHFRHSVGWRYDRLIDKHGVERIANAIRNRVLANQARRTLKREPWPAWAK